MKTVQEWKDKQFTFRKYNDDDILIEEGYTVAGKRHGISRRWYDDGTLRIVLPWHHDRLHAAIEVYLPNGRLAGKYFMHNGSGITCDWEDDGSITCRFEYLNGRWHGRYISYCLGIEEHSTFNYKGKKVSGKKWKELSVNDGTACEIIAEDLGRFPNMTIPKLRPIELIELSSSVSLSTQKAKKPKKPKRT